MGALLAVGVIELSIWQLNAYERTHQRQQLAMRSGELKAEIENRLNSAIYLNLGLAYFIRSHGGRLNREEITPWLTTMTTENPYIVNIGISPGNKISMIYPVEGNRAVLGSYLPDIPAQWPGVQQVMTTGKPSLFGPLPLIQGGIGLIHRVPIFIGGKYWGVISTVMNAETLLAVIDDHRRWPGLRIGLDKADDDSDSGFTAIWGSPLQEQPLQYRALLHLPDVTWRLTIQYQDGSPGLGWWRLPIYGALLLIIWLAAWLGQVQIRRRLEKVALKAEGERLKKSFVATVSHELRTPLTSIRGSLSLLENGMAGPLPADASRLVDIAHRNSQHLLALVNDLLDIEKLENGKLSVQLQPYRLSELLTEVLATTRAYAEQYGIEWALDNPYPDARILTDGIRFNQVLSNLMSNAAKFSPQGEQVVISVASHALGWQITVSDKGPGIPAQFIPRVFEQFAQAEDTDSRKTGGTGLGLAIAKGMTEAMGGQISFATSTTGTHFSVVFRRAEPLSTAACPRQNSPRSLRNNGNNGTRVESHPGQP
ncbi:ATP-binding protein [Zobellella aerophila]|uniref:ATP-binding protein n=1 Tax=Zobellella aerophila TaxID=870480 RepID=UPI0031E8A3D3